MPIPDKASVPGRSVDVTTIEVTQPDQTGLRIEVASGRRLWLRQHDQIVLFGLQQSRYQGVHYARTGSYRSPIPPLTAAYARRLRDVSSDDDAWMSRWAHHFARALQTTAHGPLYTGRWQLNAGMPSWATAACWQRLRPVDPDQGHITWYGYDEPEEDTREVLPLRRLAPGDASRVKSYRRQIREGIAPPALLWWVSGLQTLVVLDGHDRLAAALDENTLPQVLVLGPAPDPAVVASIRQGYLRAYEGRMDHVQARAQRGEAVPAERVADWNRDLAQQLRDLARVEGASRAWTIPGGVTAWHRQAAQLTPAWPSRISSAD